LGGFLKKILAVTLNFQLFRGFKRMGVIHIFQLLDEFKVMVCYIFQLFRELKVMGRCIFQLLEELKITSISFKK